MQAFSFNNFFQLFYTLFFVHNYYVCKFWHFYSRLECYSCTCTLVSYLILTLDIKKQKKREKNWKKKEKKLGILVEEIRILKKTKKKKKILPSNARNFFYTAIIKCNLIVNLFGPWDEENSSCRIIFLEN